MNFLCILCDSLLFGISVLLTGIIFKKIINLILNSKYDLYIVFFLLGIFVYVCMKIFYDIKILCKKEINYDSNSIHPAYMR